jgi:glycosyltransferase involved in cell wall biosynthesis
MNIDKFEIWVHDHILTNDTIRHIAYGLYQRLLYMTSPKMDFEGDITKITPEDGYEYLFGYYDKCPWSDNGKYLLALKVKNASSEADSKKPAEIVRIKLEDKSVEVLATTHTWNVQQGCMAQWISENHILYNDIRDNKYCAVILNLKNKQERVINMPVYAMSSDRKTALSLDFSRLHRLRPGYGYVNIPERTRNQSCPDDTCIWKINIETGEIMPVLKYTDFATFEPRVEMEGAEHKVNHLMISPNGQRFMVLHRWFQKGVKYTRLITCNMEGTDMFNLSDDDFVSHCCWKNDEEILSYLNKSEGGKGYYLMKDKSSQFKRCWEQLAMDGHPTYSHDGKYVVTDTYPNRRRIQSLYVMKGNKVVRVAQVFSPFKYGLDTRCDLHPRWSRDGKQICFDASFGGKRSVCIANVEKYTKARMTTKVEIDYGKAPNVSIIIPCYNCAKLIDYTLESLENQTYQDFEVVCVNDGSKDDTLRILHEWKRKGTLRLSIIDQKNGGVSNARNNGIKNAHGKYVVFLDADDMFNDDFLLRMVGVINEYGVDVVYCKYSRNYDTVVGALTDIPGQKKTQEEAMHDLLYRMGEFGLCCFVYRRDWLEKYNIYFDENTKFGEDREYNWKYLCHCTNAVYIDCPLYWYRLNQESATRSKATWRKTDLLAAVKRIEEYLEEYKCSFTEEFKSYMYERAMWAVAKTFAISGDKELFIRLRSEYDIKKCMKRTARDSNKMVAIASVCYLVRPSLFYKIVRLKIGRIIR